MASVSYHRIVKISHEGKTVSFKLRDGSNSAHIHDAIRARFGVSPSSRLLVTDEEGVDEVLDCQLPTGSYQLHVFADPGQQKSAAASSHTPSPASSHTPSPASSHTPPASSHTPSPAPSPAPAPSHTPSPAKEAPKEEKHEKLSKWSLRRTLKENDMAPALAVLHDGRLAVTAGGKTIRLWDLTKEADEPDAVLHGHWNIVFDLAVFPNGVLASAGGDWSLRFFDTKTGTLLRSHQYEQTKKFKFLLVPLADGSLLSGSQDFKDNLELWDPETGKLIRTLSGHEDTITAITTLNDLIVSSSFDRVLKLWDVRSREVVDTAELTSSVNAFAAVPNTTSLLLALQGNKDIQTYDVKSKKTSTAYAGHTADIRSLAFLNDTTFASGSDDFTVRIWDAQKHSLTNTLTGHQSRVNKLVALRKKTPDDDTLASASFDRTVRIWV